MWLGRRVEVIMFYRTGCKGKVLSVDDCNAWRESPVFSSGAKNKYIRMCIPTVIHLRDSARAGRARVTPAGPGKGSGVRGDPGLKWASRMACSSR